MASVVRTIVSSRTLYFHDRNEVSFTIEKSKISYSSSEPVTVSFYKYEEPNGANRYYRASGVRTNQTSSNYFTYLIDTDDFRIYYSSEKGNTTASLTLKDGVDVSNFEGCKFCVNAFEYPSNSFIKDLIPKHNNQFITENSQTLEAGEIANFDAWLDFDSAVDNNNLRVVEYFDGKEVSRKVLTKEVNTTVQGVTTTDYVVGSQARISTTDNKRFSVVYWIGKTSPYDGPGYHSLQVSFEPYPMLGDLNKIAIPIEGYDLVTGFTNGSTGSMQKSESGSFSTYSSWVTVQAPGTSTELAAEHYPAFLLVNEKLVPGDCNRVDDYTFGTDFPVSGSNSFRPEYRLEVTSQGIMYTEQYPTDSNPNDYSLGSGRNLALYFYAKKESPSPEPEKPYKAIIPEQTIKFSSDDAGWPTDKRYQDELQDALDAGEDVHVELTFLDDGAPYSEPIDVFAPLKLRDRGETIRISIMSDVWFSLYLFGDANGAVRTADDTCFYQGRIKFHVYTGTKPEPEPAPKPDPMMSSKWNKNFTAQYNDNSTAGEIKDFLRKEKKKITGHNIHELLDDLEEVGDGGDDSGSSCKCISLVEEITQNQNMETVHTLKGATAKEVLDAVYAGVPVGIALVNQALGGQNMGPGFLGFIYLDSSNNTYYAHVYYGLGINVSNPQNATAYGFSNKLIFSGTANAELSFVSGANIN